MSQSETFIPLNDNQASGLSIAYSCFKQLSWQPTAAKADMLMAITPRNRGAKPRTILVKAVTGGVTVSSNLQEEKHFDITSRNRKNNRAFVTVFETTAQSLSGDEDQQNLQAIETLRHKTALAAEYGLPANLDWAIDLPASNLSATYTIVAINVVVFIMMVVDGAGLFIAEPPVHIKWGSNFSLLTLSGEWWRLLTSMFIHFGVIHLALNMFCLLRIGSYLEPLLGKARFVMAFSCAGILAGIASLYWHSSPVNSAGASGAIFGMYGLFMALLTTRLITQKVRTALLPSIMVFVFCNLSFGILKIVDNAAHVGGLLSGVLLGYLLMHAIKNEQNTKGFAVWSVIVPIVVTVGASVLFLKDNKYTPYEKKQVVNALNAAAYTETGKFHTSYQTYLMLEQKAMAVYSDSTVTALQRLQDIKTIAFTEWDSAEDLAREMQNYKVSDAMKNTASILLQYAQLRKQEIDLLQHLDSNNDAGKKLSDVQKSIKQLRQKIEDR